MENSRDIVFNALTTKRLYLRIHSDLFFICFMVASLCFLFTQQLLFPFQVFGVCWLLCFLAELKDPDFLNIYSIKFNLTRAVRNQPRYKANSYGA